MLMYQEGHFALNIIEKSCFSDDIRKGSYCTKITNEEFPYQFKADIMQEKSRLLNDV